MVAKGARDSLPAILSYIIRRLFRKGSGSEENLCRVRRGYTALPNFAQARIGPERPASEWRWTSCSFPHRWRGCQRLSRVGARVIGRRVMCVLISLVGGDGEGARCRVTLLRSASLAPVHETSNERPSECRSSFRAFADRRHLSHGASVRRFRATGLLLHITHPFIPAHQFIPHDQRLVMSSPLYSQGGQQHTPGPQPMMREISHDGQVGGGAYAQGQGLQTQGSPGGQQQQQNAGQPQQQPQQQQQQQQQQQSAAPPAPPPMNLARPALPAIRMAPLGTRPERMGD